MTVNGLGEVTALAAADPGAANNVNSSLLGLGKQLSNYLILGTHSPNGFMVRSLQADSFMRHFLRFVLF